jgi:MoaA/NifB/PqqE/SkfB family radical SAM enzyme
MFKFIENLSKLSLKTVQVEVSSYCNASCIYCPHYFFSGKIENNFLPSKAIDIILSNLSPKTYIHLQGWGEPLAHPEFINIAEKIKNIGFKAGTTTNGSLLTEDMLEKLVDMKIDYIAFSTAGCSHLSNDFIRKKTSLKDIAEKISILKEIKKRKNSTKPKIHIADILFKSSLQGFFSSLEFYNEIKPDQVVVSSISLACSREMEKEAFLAKNREEFDILKSRLRSFRDKILTDINYHIVAPDILRNQCSEDIKNSLFIGSKGDVFPCVFLGLPLKEKADIYIRGAKQEIFPQSFGNIFETSLKDIRNSSEYKKFLKTCYSSNEICRLCLKRSIDCIEPETRSFDFDSLNDRWEVVRSVNEQTEDRKRLETELESRRKRAFKQKN